jgi:uncharacterized protein (DUF849 family)
MIQAAINGKRSRQEHLHLPVTALELLHASESALKAGAETIHFHVRNSEGKETFDPGAVALQVGQLKGRSARYRLWRQHRCLGGT